MSSEYSIFTPKKESMVAKARRVTWRMAVGYSVSSAVRYSSTQLNSTQLSSAQLSSTQFSSVQFSSVILPGPVPAKISVLMADSITSGVAIPAQTNRHRQTGIDNSTRLFSRFRASGSRVLLDEDPYSGPIEYRPFRDECHYG